MEALANAADYRNSMTSASVGFQDASRTLMLRHVTFCCHFQCLPVELCRV
jgi:hypothetical protein